MLPIPVTGVSLSPTNVTVNVTESIQLTATVQPSDATNKLLNWESSNENVATVDTNGNVTGVAAGSADVTVTTIDGSFPATSHIIVNAVIVPGPGDVNNDGLVDLRDAISALRVLLDSNASVHTTGDINGDNKIGLEEVVYILQTYK